MLNNNNKKNYVQLMFWFVKTVHYYSAGPESKMDYHMSMLFAYMAGGEGVGVRGFKMFCQRGQNFFYLLCVCVCVGGGGGVDRFSTSPSVKKITDPLLLRNDWSL